MSTVPGTNVEVTFLTFTGAHPDIYYSANEGKRNLASINAGNSSAACLCVGLSGVNGEFLSVLGATQKRANLSPKQNCIARNYDDYQDRHLKLLAQADAGKVTWESYSNTDPCAFSFVNPARISATAGYVEGVCFVDVFDPTLCPYGNSLNVAMLYAAPPFDGNYKTKGAFLVAIEEMAENIVKTVSAYNAVASQQKQPVIEVVRNTLYSSGYYNKKLQASQDEIARAIFKGYLAQLNLDTNSGLLELQFPVGDAAKNQDHPLFGAVEQDLNQTPAPARHFFAAIRGGTAAFEPAENPDADDVPMEQPVAVEAVGEDANTLFQTNQTIVNASTKLFTATQALDHILAPGAPLPAPLVAAGMEVAPNGNQYESTSLAIGAPKPAIYDRLLADAEVLGNSPTKQPIKDVLSAARGVARAVERFGAAKKLLGLKPFRDLANRAAADAERFAAAAERAAANGTALDQQAAAQARIIATESSALAKELDALFTTQERVQSVLRDANGRVAVKRVVGAAIAQGVANLALVGGTIVGLLYRFHVLGGGALPPAAGPQPQPVDAGGLDDGNPVTVDVVALNVAQNSSFPADNMVASVQLFDPAGGQLSSAWATMGTTVTYTPGTKPAKGSSVTVNYAFNYTDPSVPQSNPVLLTITFVDPAIVQAPALGASTVTFNNLPDQYIYPTTPPANWTLDQIAKTATYNVPTPAPVAVSLPFQIGQLPSGTAPNTAQLVILFAPSGVTLSTAASTTTATPSSALPAIGVMMNTVWTLLDAAGKPATPVSATQSSVTVGTWTISNGSILFRPSTTAPPAAGSNLSVNFALQFTDPNGNVTLSQPAAASITFATGMVTNPNAVPYTLVAPNRPSVTSSNPNGAAISIPFAQSSLFTGVTVMPNTATDGSYSWTAATASTPPQLTFTPGTGFTNQASLTATYTATNLTGSATITVIFAVDISTELNRYPATAVNIAGGATSYNPAIAALGTVQSVAVTQSGAGSWTDLSMAAMPMPGYVQFDPPATGIVQTGPTNIVYTITLVDGTTTITCSASITATFSDTFEAYDFVTTATSSQLASPIPFSILNYVYFPSGSSFGSLAIDSQIPYGVWSMPSPSSWSVTLTATPPYASQYVLNYSGTDQNSNTVSASITVNQPATTMPMAADFLLSKDVWSAKKVDTAAGMDVLSNCRAFYGIDPGSVTLLGPVDLGADYAAPAAFGITGTSLAGKQLRIPKEGSWLVADDGKIGFVAEVGLTQPPTPVAYQFCDKKGNLSDPAVLILDAALDDAMTNIPNAFEAMSDSAFWAYFQKHAIWWTPRLDNDQFVAACTLLAGITHALGQVGPCPISSKELAQTFDTWSRASWQWHELSGKQDPGHLFSICQVLVDSKTKGTKLTYRARYWRLSLMARLVSYNPIVTLVTN